MPNAFYSNLTGIKLLFKEFIDCHAEISGDNTPEFQAWSGCSAFPATQNALINLQFTSQLLLSHIFFNAKPFQILSCIHF